MAPTNMFGEQVPEGLCKAPLENEPWENCEYCQYNRTTGFIECHNPEGDGGCCHKDIERGDD